MQVSEIEGLSALRTTAAAPSLIREQSLSRSGGATSGFVSLIDAQCSTESGLCICASGLDMALMWFLLAIRAIAGNGSPYRSAYARAASANTPGNDSPASEASF